jgi:hypothetical protein
MQIKEKKIKVTKQLDEKCSARTGTPELLKISIGRRGFE